MIKNQIEATTDEQFKRLCDMVTKDIKANRIYLGQKTYLDDVKDIFHNAKGVLRRVS